MLDALGVATVHDPAAVDRQIDTFGLGLFFAPAFHPALKALAQVRRNLGTYTVFNLMGPLLNPEPSASSLVSSAIARCRWWRVS